MTGTDLVIGSGPSGIAAAHALLARGRRVILVDGGKDLEPDRAKARESLAGKPVADWTNRDRDTWQAPQFAGIPGLVRRYGSDFAMEPAEQTFAAHGAFALRASRAIGGLSNLWGSAVLPYAEPDLSGWPISADDLGPHYRAVTAFLPVSGKADDLEYVFPELPMSRFQPMDSSPQAVALLKRLSEARTRLGAMGVHAGLARQAVTAGCRLCGQCLHGCPFGLIWSARQGMAALGGRPGFDHRPGSVVRALEEASDGVTAYLADGRTIPADRAYLAAGVLETARILLASGTAAQLVLRDSQQAFLPALHSWSAGRRPDRGAFHTLAQIFIELFDPVISPHVVHAQLYTWNEYYARDLIASYGRLPGSAPFLRILARRLIVSQVFLHSDHSASIHLSLAADGRLIADCEINPDTSRRMQAALKRIAAALKLGGMAPLPFAARHGAPGASFHVGASLPMATTPGPGQSDRLGRPYGHERIHVVDASVLPAIPATTITFSVMANAHRIAATDL